MSVNPPNPKQRFGAQKPDLSLVPPVGELHMAMALENGAGKYGAFNWRDTGVEARTYIAAAKRHLQNYLDGEDIAPDSGVHNLGHVMACCGILLDAASLGKLIDNRPAPGKSSEVQESLKAQKVQRAAEALLKIETEAGGYIGYIGPAPVRHPDPEPAPTVPLVCSLGKCVCST